MHVKSAYPEVPPVPDTNAHLALLGRPDQANWPEFTFHIDARTGKTRTFREFRERVKYAATALGAPVSQGGLGLSAENGDIIGIMSDNCMDYITFVHACLYIATPFALISALSKPFELKHALKVSKATCLFVNEKLLSAVLPAATELGISSMKIFPMAGHVSGRRSFAELIDETRLRKADFIPVRSVRKDTLAYLIFSSGTTGLPKAVMLSHGNVVFSLYQFAIMAAASTSTPPVLKTPEGIPRPSLGPMTSVIMESWDSDLALPFIPKYQISHLTLVPSTIHQLVHHPKTSQTDFSSVVSVACGAAYLPPELKEKFNSLAPAEARFVEGYGMSESVSAIILPHPNTTEPESSSSPPPSHSQTLTAIYQPIKDMPASKRGTMGTLAPGVEARITLDDDGPHGTLAAPNQIGNLWLTGYNIALGYWNNEQATKETFVDGWLKTGDKFSVDEDGYFHFADRAKDILKVSGVQVSPVEIENVLLAHPQKLIQDVTVAGVSGGRISEKVPRAWVVLSPEGKKLGASRVVKVLDDWQQENLSKYKWLRGGIEVVKELPKSPTGKVLRKELQEKYEKSVAQKKVKGKL